MAVSYWREKNTGRIYAWDSYAMRNGAVGWEHVTQADWEKQYRGEQTVTPITEELLNKMELFEKRLAELEKKINEG